MTAATTVVRSLAPAYAGGVKVGVLKCRIDGGFGLVITLTKILDCILEPRQYRWCDRCVGPISKIGADFGFTNEAYLVWAVFATGSVERGCCEGHYFGASGEATAGIGAGASVLHRGFQHSVSLQPVSPEGQTVLNVAGGVAGFKVTKH